MDSKVIKLKTHPRNFCEEELIVNLDALSKEKFHLEEGDIIEVSASEKDECKSPLILQVQRLSQDIQSNGGPLSISKELAQMFNLEGVREVCVKKVERENVGLDLVELRFKDQCLTRSDMWRFSCSLIGRCVYMSKKVEFAGVRCQVSGLWSRGEKAQSGAIVDSSRVVYRSASAHFFIFIQISSEMWEFDSSGDLYFDKAEGGFLKELFSRWKEDQCNHEVTIVFFWRIYYSKDLIDQLPQDSAIHYNKRGKCYEDFYKVIAQEMMTDWSSCLVDIKQNFNQLRDLLIRARGKDVTVSPASEGNILEAINLAVNVYEKSYQNCNFQLTGQQIVIVTPGVGVFEVERDLTMMTRERIIDTGVGVDLISLTEQPLHAVPLFKFHSSAPLDNQEYYNLPHWINYSFYNPGHLWDRYRYTPILELSDHLISSHLKRKASCSTPSSSKESGKLYQPHRDVQLSPHTHSSSCTLKKVRALYNKQLNHDEHDASIFSSGEGRSLGGVGKVHSAGKLNLSLPLGMGRRRRVRHSSLNEDTGGGGVAVENVSGPSSDVTFKIAFSPQETDEPFESDAFASPTSASTSPTSKPPAPSLKDATFLPSHLPRAQYHSETSDLPPLLANSASSHTLCPTYAGSAESLPKYSRLAAESHGKLEKDMQILVTTKKTKFINPFDPMKVHGELTAFHRRWVHTFPQDKGGLAFQTHHSILLEEDGEEEGESLDSLSTSTTIRNMSRRSSNISGGRSWSDTRDGQEFRSLRQFGGRRSHGASISSSYGETGLGSFGSHEGTKAGGGSSVPGPDSKVEKSRSHSSQSSRQERKRSHDGALEGRLARSKITPPRSRVTPPSWRKQGWMHIVSDSSTKNVEDFTSIRRTGVDWNSLTEPACLPITVDYFPSKNKLEQDYYESPSKLVVSSYGSDTPPPSRKLRPWIADHQKVDTFEAFREMISQRLSQGFQLVFDSKTSSEQQHKLGSSRWPGHASVSLVSISALHRTLSEQKEALDRKSKSGKVTITGGSITVRLSLGKVFQKLELAYPDIYIHIYKQKVLYHPKPFAYSYQLCGAGSSPGHAHNEDSVFRRSETKFEYYRVEDYNWNYLDQHVLGFPDFEELQDSHKYWRCRYLLLPSTPPPEVHTSPSGFFDEEQQEVLMGRDQDLIANFVRFMEFLNHIKRSQPQSQPQSRASSIAPPVLRRNQSLPASHLMLNSSVLTPRRDVTTPVEFNSLMMTSPVTIQSPFGAKSQKRLSEIREAVPSSNHKPPFSELAPGSHSKAPPDHQTTPISSEKQGSRRERKLRSTVHTPSHEGLDSRASGRRSANLDSATPIRRAVSRDNIPAYSDAEEAPLLSSPAPPLSKGSPQMLRRRHSRDELASPFRETRDLNFATSAGGRNLAGVGEGFSPRHNWGSTGSVKSSMSVVEGRQKLDRSPEIVVDDVSESSLSTSSFDTSIQLLDATSPPSLILKVMEHPEEGVDFLASQPGLGDHCCFIALEAVGWVLEKVGVPSRKEAVIILQAMVKEQLILHASMDLNVPFLDGFFIYCVGKRMSKHKEETRKNGKDDFERSFLMVSPEYETFSKQWFEVAVEHPLPAVATEQNGTTLDYSPTPSSFVGCSPYASPYTADYTVRLFSDRNLQNARINRSVELNPDPQFKSDRPEWCYVHYDNRYHPHRGFQLELQWMVSTITLFNQLIQNWTHKAGMCGFNLVPVPMLQGLSKEKEKDCHPFGYPQHIPLHLPPSLPASCPSNLGEAVGQIMTAILLRLGFILDPASTQDDLLDYNATLPVTCHFYVHHSGVALVRPTCPDSLIKIMDKQRRFRTSSLGTTLGRGDYAGDMGQDYTDEVVPEGSGVGTLEGSGWGMFREGSALKSHRRNSNTPVVSPDVFDGKWLGRGRRDSSSPSLLQCGFDWYKNTLLFRHKSTTGNTLAECEAVRERLVALCSNKDGKLYELCDRVLGINCAEPCSYS